MNPTALYHMIVSSSRSYADRLLAIEAERSSSLAGMERSGIPVQCSALLASIYVNALGHVAVTLTEDPKEERFGLLDLLEADV